MNEMQKILEQYKAGEIPIDQAEHAIDGIVETAIGQYEEAGFARNWTERNAIYSRNANRKVIRTNYYKIKNGEGDKI